MINIKISNSDELIRFINETDLVLSDYLKIIKVYFNHSFFGYTANKRDLINFVEQCTQHQKKGWELPLFLEQKGRYFNIRDIYNNEEN